MSPKVGEVNHILFRSPSGDIWIAARDEAPRLEGQGFKAIGTAELAWDGDKWEIQKMQARLTGDEAARVIDNKQVKE